MCSVPAVRGPAPETVDALIEATIEQLEAVGELGVRLDAVAERAGMTVGAIYHHFGDKDGLIDAARLRQFTLHADADTEALRSALTAVNSYDELMRALPQISGAYQTPERVTLRARRMANLAATLTRPDYAARIAEVQHRVTGELAGIIEDLKARHILGTEADSHALATFIQAYTLGRVVADVDSEPVPAERWNQMLLIALRSLMPPPLIAETPPAGGTTSRGQATARAMLDAARRQIETRPDGDFRADEVLSEVGASPSSLYHYFGSREGLVEAAWIDWARHNADADVGAVVDALENARTRVEAFEGLLRVVSGAQHPSRTERRLQRLTMFAAAARRPNVRVEIGRLETETNERHLRALEVARDRGLLGEISDLDAIPVFVRAFTFGRITNELSAEPIDADQWNATVAKVLARLLGMDDLLN